jgi:hypothetical protein
MKYVILFLLTATSVFSQEKIIVKKRFDLNFLLTDNVFEEALKKYINSDNVRINFIVNENCKIETFEIEKEGKLESFFKEINSQKQKLIKLFEEQIDCEWVKRQGVKGIKHSYPITFELK